ncbi:MAG: hypothetical protein ACREH4_14245, partial [Vitreimonas sp.]
MLVVLPIHITAGALSVFAGAAALVFRKGGKAHRTAGAVFVVSIAIMALTAAVVGMDDPSNAGAAAVTIYLIGTAWVTARRREKKAGLFEIAAFIVALTLAALGYWSAYLIATGAKEADNPYIVYASLFLNSAIALAALGDLSVALRRGITGAQRIARHLWRMCFGLFIAVGSFAAQGADALPAAFPGGEVLLASMLAVLLVMAYWSVRVLFTGWYSKR